MDFNARVKAQTLSHGNIEPVKQQAKRPVQSAEAGLWTLTFEVYDANLQQNQSG
jgi:hypothetical protein